MTAEMLDKACQKNDYLILRHIEGAKVGINCRGAEIAKRMNGFKGTWLTLYVSFKPCTFQEYISHKIGFLPHKPTNR